MLSNIKVLIIPSWYPTSTDPIPGIFIQQQALALQEIGLNVAVLFFQERIWHRKKPYSSKDDGLLVIRSSGIVIPKRINSSRYLWLKQWDKLFQHYTKYMGPPDLLHAHSFVGGYVAKYLSKKYSIPYIITEHYGGFIKDKIPKHWQADLKNIYQSASRVIAVSTSLSQKLSQYTSIDAQVIPNMVNTDIFFPRKKLIPNLPIRLISVGHLTHTKNHTFLLKAISKLSTPFNIQLSIIGKGPLLNVLQQQTKQLGIEQQVNFIPQLSPSEIAHEMHKSHLFIFASKAETFGIVLIEAIACGLPIISTPCGIAEELVALGAGKIVKTEEEMANAIMEILPQIHTFPPSQLHEIIQKKFSKKEIVQFLNRLYKEVIKH
ncbi:MAG: glycosyltransferase [Chitinophagales bacterium]|nr:glycosyltransferase [Chitinophagales bacterium]